MEENKQEKNPYAVSPEDSVKALSVPAVLTNRFIVNWDAFGIRISFGEQISETEKVFRTAVTMNMESAISLYQLLEKMLQDANVKIEEKETND